MLPIAEFFGFAVGDNSPAATHHRDNRLCPFLAGPCTKRAGNGERLGTCSRASTTGSPIVICPKRFAAGGEELPRIIAREAEPGKILAVVPEVPVGRKLGRLDWVLADLASDGSPMGTIYGVEAQAVDTTGSLKPYVDAYFAGDDWNVVSHPSGINWKNVWKRIVPQILAKGRLFEAQHSRLYVVMQDVLVDYLGDDMRLEASRPGEDPNIIFYAFHLQPTTPGPGYELVLRNTFKTTLRLFERAVGDVSSLPTWTELAASVKRRVAEAGVTVTAGVPVVPRPADGGEIEVTEADATAEGEL